MANGAFTNVDALVLPIAKPLRLEDSRVLASIAPGDSAVIASLELEPDMAAWLSAVGIGRGERVTVLRRAAFGGPIHVRTAAGGEFAIARSLARAIATVP
jgi:ferrous iron transport protein A